MSILSACTFLIVILSFPLGVKMENERYFQYEIMESEK